MPTPNITGSAVLEISARLTLDESMIRALDHISKWSPKSLIAHTGSCGDVHQKGFSDFIALVQRDLAPILRRTDDARAVFSGLKKAVDKDV